MVETSIFFKFVSDVAFQDLVKELNLTIESISRVDKLVKQYLKENPQVKNPLVPISQIYDLDDTEKLFLGAYGYNILLNIRISQISKEEKT